jgi:hypothetical protein
LSISSLSTRSPLPILEKIVYTKLFTPSPDRDPQGDLHHQRGRIAEHEPAQGAEAARGLPQRRRGIEGDVPGAAQCDCEMGTSEPLERGVELLHPSVGGSHPRSHRNVAQFSFARMILHTAGCGQIIQLSERRKKRKHLARIITTGTAFTQKPEHYRAYS